MIRLPKLFKRNSETEDLDRASVRGRRAVNNLVPRSFQRAQENEELALTEDPDQQRARHRLIGAAVLVLIAVVGLPRILDNKPKSVNNDIAVNIVTSLPASSAAIPSNDGKVNPTAAVEAPAKQKAPTLSKEVLVTAPTAVSKTNLVSGLAAGEEVIDASNVITKSKTEDLPKKVGPGKYVIQIGAFASEANVKALSARLKSQNIPSYTLSKAGTDGGKIFLVRAGPFTDKDIAEAAEKKIKAMGLSPRLVESGKQ